MRGVFCLKLSWNGSAEFPLRRTGSQCCRRARSHRPRFFFGLHHLHFSIRTIACLNARSHDCRTNREERHEFKLQARVRRCRRRRARGSGHPRAARSSQTESLQSASSKRSMLRPTPHSPSCPGCAKGCGWSQFAHWRRKDCCIRGAAPKRVAITEWDSLEQAEAYYKSKAWNDLAPQRDKALKTIRRYAVEAVN